MKIYVVAYSSYFDEIYSENKLFTDPNAAAKSFSDYVNDIAADYDMDVWGEVKDTDNGGKKLTINTDTWSYDVELKIY